ncbi:uncharacterized protein LOC136085162 [Hydra vulgaris]|uniref:Uncharacterized protein LOC136085162 n=1 Tax=Hydra vulgaris TaxID=6087 RepID=A0ABM4CL62_HYDVU
MRKSELLEVLAHTPVERTQTQSTSVEHRNILDDHISDISSSTILTPTPYIATNTSISRILDYWYIARALNKKDNHPERVDKELKNSTEKINWDKIEFPVSLNQITQFENKNQDISVNVYVYENSEVHTLHVSKNNDRKHLIDLQLISNGETNHYCLIKNLSRLLSLQISNKHCKKHYSRNCLLGFNSEESLSNHKSYCETRDSVRIELPPPNLTMQFTNHNKSTRVPKFVTFTAISETDDAAQIFVDRLEEDIKKIYGMIKFPKKMIFTTENKHNFNAAISCHICAEKLNEDKVRDHCHSTGKYRGAAHRNCNLNYKIPKFFPVLFHNLSGYGSPLFKKELSGGKLSCIPNNEKKYISFSREIKVDEHIKEGKKVEVKRELRFLEFNETQLPLKESFFSKLNDEDINDDDYSHAQNVWNEFNCKTLRDYHDLFNVSDVLLRADVFENFRDVGMNCYKLDPAWLGTSNNKYMDDKYDQSKPSTFIQYLDANNLYGWAMSKPLPAHSFK